MSNLSVSKTNPLRITAPPSPALLHFPTKVGDIVEFPQGLPGFESECHFRFRMEEEYQPFLFMDALGDSPLCFVCVDTFYIRPDYQIRIPQETIRRLAIHEPQQVGVFSIVTVRAERTEITANLLSPLVVNVEIMRGEQVILEGSDYPVQFRIWDTLSIASPQPCGRQAM